MLELKALSPADGWAIVANGDDVYLIRPPYRLTQRERLAPEKVAAVVKHLDLWAREDSFSGWRELIEYLRGEMARHADPKYSGRAAESSRRILERASVEDLHRHLDRLRDRLERGDWRGTLRALNVLLALETVRGDAGLFEECRRLLDRCGDTRQSPGRDLQAASETRKNWFRNVFEAYSPEVVDGVAAEITRRHQVLPMAV